jgi:Mrp family chromosome partitioning ATPase
MSKVKDAFDLAQQIRQGIGGNRSVPNRRVHDPFSARRQVPTRVVAEDWIGDLPFLAKSAAADPESRTLVGDGLDEQVKSSYKMLRTRILQRIRQNNWRIIGVTSPMQGDGKTLTSVNLALSLAREETLSVVLAEFDLRRPSVCRQLGVEPAFGLSDYLEDRVELKRILFRPEGTERFAVLPNIDVYENSSETLSSPKIMELMDGFRKDDRGTIVICDLPPFLVTDDVLAFAPLADAFLVVVSEGKTSRDVLKKGVDILQELPVLGVVLNRSEEATSGYYY